MGRERVPGRGNSPGKGLVVREVRIVLRRPGISAWLGAECERKG